jgi:hypothetical protein
MASRIGGGGGAHRVAEVLHGAAAADVEGQAQLGVGLVAPRSVRIVADFQLAHVVARLSGFYGVPA